jgi:putative flippase GtrA
MSMILNIQFVRYLLVGGLNTGISYMVYAVLLYVGFNYILANLGAAMLGILFSFRTQGRLVFKNHDSRLIFRFATVWGLLFLVNIMLISTLIQVGLNAYWAGATALIPITLLSFFVQKFFVFGTSQSTCSAISTK